jgi:hypothetical protein
MVNLSSFRGTRTPRREAAWAPRAEGARYRQPDRVPTRQPGQPVEHVLRRRHLGPGQEQHLPRQISPGHGNRERRAQVLGVQRLERLIAAVDHRHGRRRADDLEEVGEHLVAGAVDVARPEDQPVAREAAHQLFGLPLGDMVGRGALIGTQGGDVDEALHPCHFSLGQQVARASHVDRVESDLRRFFLDDAGDVEHGVATLGRAGHLGSVGHAPLFGRDIRALPALGIPPGMAREQPHGMAGGEKGTDGGGADDTCSTGDQDLHDASPIAARAASAE